MEKVNNQITRWDERRVCILHFKLYPFARVPNDHEKNNRSIAFSFKLVILNMKSVIININIE